MTEQAEAAQQRWSNSTASYDAHTLKIAGYHVMEDWERPYMQRLAEIAASNGGTVLEVGYGMGISAAALQARNVASHVVIECHPDVIARCVEQHRSALASGAMHLLTGYWQDVTPMLAAASVDGILFDTYPVAQDEGVGTHMFFFEEAYRLLKPGGVLTYFSSEPTTLGEAQLARLEQAGFQRSNIHFELCPVSPPENCTYWQSSTIVAPTVVK